MKKLPYMRPVAQSLPVVYESELSYYEYLNNLYVYIQQEVLPLLEEMQQLLDSEWDQMKADVLSNKTRISALETYTAALNIWRASVDSWKDTIDEWKRGTAVSIHELQLKTNQLEASLTSTSEALTELSTQFSSFKSTANNRLNTLESWKTIMDAWQTSTSSAVEALQLDNANNKERIAKLEQGTVSVDVSNFMGTTLNVGNILEEAGYTAWADVLGKTITLGIVFGSSTCEGSAVPTITGAKIGTINIMKTTALSNLTGKSLTVNITPVLDENGVIQIDQTAHFNTSASALYGGIITTGLDPEDPIDMTINLTGFNAATAAQSVILMR